MNRIESILTLTFEMSMYIIVVALVPGVLALFAEIILKATSWFFDLSWAIRAPLFIVVALYLQKLRSK